MNEGKKGILYAIAAYGCWGVYPLYWKLLVTVAPLQIISHRLVWSFVFVIALVLLKGQLGEVRRVLRQPRLVLTLLTSSTLLTANWLLYIWAVNSGQIVESSMGYYINPLVSMVLGMIFLKERVDLAQGAAIGLALLGVGYMVISYGRLPWIALLLAISFGLYGLIRKTVPVDSITGLLLETALLFPPFLAYLIYLAVHGQGAFISQGVLVSLLLAFCGVITACPLIWVVLAAKRLSLKTLGFCQYLAPTLMLLIGVLIYGEPFTAGHRISFGLIWAAIAVYSIAQFRLSGKVVASPPQEAGGKNI